MTKDNAHSDCLKYTASGNPSAHCAPDQRHTNFRKSAASLDDTPTVASTSDADIEQRLSRSGLTVEQQLEIRLAVESCRQRQEKIPPLTTPLFRS